MSAGILKVVPLSLTLKSHVTKRSARIRSGSSPEKLILDTRDLIILQNHDLGQRSWGCQLVYHLQFVTAPNAFEVKGKVLSAAEKGYMSFKDSLRALNAATVSAKSRLLLILSSPL
jgi:hypothetical protein